MEYYETYRYKRPKTMKNKNFYDEHHAKMYLVDSIIRYKNKPIFIQDIQKTEQGYKLTYNYLGNLDFQMAFIPNKDINFNPVPLGFLNKDKKAYYISRIPCRIWKIGLCFKNMSVFNILDHNIKIKINVDSKEINNTIIGKYPSYDKSYEFIRKEKVNCIAFSRRFVICKNGLFYKTNIETIGFLNNPPELHNKFKYLTEVLEEDLK